MKQNFSKRSTNHYLPALSVFLSFHLEVWINLFSLPGSTHSFRDHNPSAVCITVLRNKWYGGQLKYGPQSAIQLTKTRSFVGLLNCGRWPLKPCTPQPRCLLVCPATSRPTRDTPRGCHRKYCCWETRSFHLLTQADIDQISSAIRNKKQKGKHDMGLTLIGIS